MSEAVKGEKNRKLEVIQSHQWDYQLTQVFFELMMARPEGFTSDDVWESCATRDIPSTYISRHIGGFFRSMKAAGWIRKLGTYRTSTRNGSSPLPIYVQRQMSKGTR